MGRIAGLGLTAFVLGGLGGWIFGGSDSDGTVTTADPTTTIPRARQAPDAAPVTEATTTTTIDPNAPVRLQIGSGQPVTFVFGGDIHFDGPLATTLADDPGAILAGVQPTIQDADVAVVNLETAIGVGGRKAAKEFNFRASPAAFSALTTAGVDVIGMANNHALDYGQEGLTETLAAVAATQAPVIGVGENEAAALKPWTSTVNGQRVSVIAATSVLDGNLIDSWTATEDHPGVASAKRVDQLVAAVEAARKESDTVVVFLHWGTETKFCANQNQLDLAPAPDHRRRRPRRRQPRPPRPRRRVPRIGLRRLRPRQPRLQGRQRRRARHRPAAGHRHRPSRRLGRLAPRPHRRQLPADAPRRPRARRRAGYLELAPGLLRAAGRPRLLMASATSAQARSLVPRELLTLRYLG